MTENESLWIFITKIIVNLGQVSSKAFMRLLLHMSWRRGITYTRQQGIVIKYEEKILDVGIRTDIIMEGKLVVEIKSTEHLEKVHHKTVLTYLKLSGLKLAILVNFNVNLINEGIYRKIQGELI